MTDETDATAGPVTPAARPPLGLVFASLLRADGTVLLRNRIATIVSLLVPVAVILATGIGNRTSRLGGPDLTIGLALTSGLIASSLLGYAIGMAQDREAGVLQRLRVTPAPTWTIMTSRLAIQLVASLVSSIVALIVGVILHGLDLNAGQVASVLAVALLGAAVFLSIGQALVGLVDSTTGVSAIGRVLFIVLILLGIFGATGILGDTVKVIAQWSPVGALMTLFAEALSLSAWSDQDTTALLVCVGYVIVFAFIGIRWFRWDSR